MSEGDAGRDDGQADGRGESGPRGWVVVLITAAVVAALVGGAVAIDRFVLDDDGEPVEVDAAPSTIEDEIDVEPVATSATRLFTRTTETGIEIRVNESDDGMMWGPGFQVEGVPDWCVAESTVAATALTPDAIGSIQMPRSKEAPPDPAISFGVGGIIEETPLALIVAQVRDEVRQARISHPSGATDSMEPIEGLVALAVSVPLPDDDDENFFDPWGGIGNELALEVLYDDGTSDRFTRNQIMNGIPMWGSPECNPGMEAGPGPEMTAPDLSLPKPGVEQPLDPAAEEALITDAFVALYRDIGDKDTLFRYVDDASGIDLTMVGIMREHGDAFREMEPEILEMVFFSPIEASFVYTTGLDPWQDGFTGELQSFGRARLVEGAWRITRSTVCQDIMRVGIQCTI